MRAGLAVAALALVAAALWWTRVPEAPPERAGGAPPAGPASAPAPATALPPATTAPPAADDGRLALPDGTSVPCLNGARGAPALQRFWGDRPYAAIVRTERSDLGVEWYVHADGTRSTTEMKWRPDLGRMDAMTRVARPMEQAPAVPAAGDRR